MQTQVESIRNPSDSSVGRFIDTLKYGLVVDGMFYSNRMEIRVGRETANGIYSMDMSQEDFKASLTPADFDSAVKSLRKASKFRIVRGVTFHDGFIPEDPVKFPHVPIKVMDAVYDEFEEVEVAMFQNGICYFLRLVTTGKAYPLMDVKSRFEEEAGSIDDIKGVSPEVRVVYTYHVVEREEQRRQAELVRLEAERQEAAARRIRAAGERAEALRKAAEAREAEINGYIKQLGEPGQAIRRALEASGAKVQNIKKVNRGYEVAWSSAGHNINTLFDNALRVIEGGFCMSGYDETQSVTSIARVLNDYVRDGSHVFVTRHDGHARYRRDD